MAATVTWEGLRDLALFRAENGCAISLYLDLDPSVSPTRGEVDVRVNALVDAIERSEAAARAELTHEQKAGSPRRRRPAAHVLRRGLQPRGLARVRRLLRRPRQRLAAAAAQRARSRSHRGSAESFHLAPLVPLVGRGEGVLVAVVGRERGDLYLLSGRRLEELVEHFDEQPGRHDQGGWSQARYQRHIDKLVAGPPAGGRGAGSTGRCAACGALDS